MNARAMCERQAVRPAPQRTRHAAVALSNTLGSEPCLAAPPRRLRVGVNNHHHRARHGLVALAAIRLLVRAPEAAGGWPSR
eukprot:1472839-Pyramimonas_sp.AAC.1